MKSRVGSHCMKTLKKCIRKEKPTSVSGCCDLVYCSNLIPTCLLLVNGWISFKLLRRDLSKWTSGVQSNRAQILLYAFSQPGWRCTSLVKWSSSAQIAPLSWVTLSWKPFFFLDHPRCWWWVHRTRRGREKHVCFPIWKTLCVIKVLHSSVDTFLTTCLAIQGQMRIRQLHSNENGRKPYPRGCDLSVMHW